MVDAGGEGRLRQRLEEELRAGEKRREERTRMTWEDGCGSRKERPLARRGGHGAG